MAWTFAGSRKTINASNLTKYYLYAWGSPLVTVFTCVLLNFFLPESKIYGVAACWISNKWALLGGFALPGAAVITCNVVLFALTACKLNKMSQLTQRVSSTLSPKRRLLLYVKMSSLLGFTWMFGFLASIFNSNWLWYSFIVFNSFQGISIFIAYVLLNKGVWNHFARKRRNEEKIHNDSGSKSGSKTITTKL